MEFVAFSSISHLSKLEFAITQKIHGTNAQILITEDGQVQAGSRNRWIYVGDDNFGFASWVEANKAELIALLGPGRHFGEWAGPGINSGEGLTEKTFLLFEYWKYPPERPMPLPNIRAVPLLYRGAMSPTVIQEVMDDLRINGSKLVPGFMRPEGIVISINNARFKAVFDAEETKWKDPDSSRAARKKAETVDYSHLLQPIRLEKLLSRDEVYIREYPLSLPLIVTEYVQDLIKEEQITGDDDMIRAVTRGASGQIFAFVRNTLTERGY